MAIGVITGSTNSSTRERVEHDYYATPFSTTEALLKREPLIGPNILEPCAGEGHLAAMVKTYYPDTNLVCTELMDRKDIFDLGIQTGVDFLTHDYGQIFDTVIANPPFEIITPFIEKCLKIGNKVIILARANLLETKSREHLFKDTGFKYAYIFTNRQAFWPDGKSTQPNGKPWGSAVMFAWFVWEKDYKGEPIIRWL